MTPDDPTPESIDTPDLARLLAYDATLYEDGAVAGDERSGPSPSTVDDERARGRLLLLLGMIEAAEAAAGTAAAEMDGNPSDAPDESGRFLSRFEFLEDLGAGGFGFVVRARDRVLGREVALKMPLPERMLVPGDLRRFLREARAAARLDHPSIVRVHDAGQIGSLGYFIASEFCEGPNLRRWQRAQAGPVPPATAARWLTALADAVQHAHDRGILHRDIKPDNVILAPANGPDGYLPRLTDFGLAKLVEEAGDDSRTGVRVGTPQYMAPEQAAGRRGEVGPAADVYALGATLYELLTGRPSFRGETEAETLRLVVESEPLPPRTLRPALPRDLETICLKCLRKEPARRYPTAAGLRDDLRRFLDGRPIRARRTSPAERAWRWGLRNPVMTALVAVVFALLAAVAGVATVGYMREAAHRAVAEAAEDRANAEAGRARSAEREIRRQWYAASVNLMQPAWDAGQVGRLRELLAATGDYPDRGFEWSYWRRVAHLERSTLVGHRAGVRSVAWSPDGKRLATASWDGTARVWDADGRPILTLRGHTGQVNAVAWSPDGTRLATAGWDGTARVWDAAQGRRLLTLEGTTGRVWSLAWSPDGKRLATGGEDGMARVWDADDGREVLATGRHGGYVVGMAWSPDGRRLATGGADRTARVWDAGDGRERLRLAGHSGWVSAVAWSPDGGSLATASWDGTVRVWDANDGRERRRLQGHAGWINAVAWSPDGTRLATGSSDGTARVRPVGGGPEALVLKGPSSQVNAVAWSPDGRRLAVGSADGTARVWQTPDGREAGALVGHAGAVNAVAWSPDGKRLATASWDGTARVWDAAGGRQPVALDGHAGRTWSSAWSPDGTRLATGHDDGTARVWEADGGREIVALRGHGGRVLSVSWSPDGDRLATASWDGTARVWDVDDRRTLAVLGHPGEVWSVAWSPDGSRLATGARDGTARVWVAADGREILAVKGHKDRVVSVSWSPDGRRLATGGVDGLGKVWEVAIGREVLVLGGHTGEVRSLTWSPDGRRLATASADGTAKVWDAEGGRELLTLRGHTGYVRSVSWSPDGARLATAGDDGPIRIWEAADAGAMATWDRRERELKDVQAADDFRGPGAQGYIRDWLLLLPIPLDPFEGGPEALDRRRLPDEANLRPRDGDRAGVGQDLAWRAHHPAGPVLDFDAVLGRTGERSLAYALCYLESDRAREDVWLRIGSDDQAAVSINGREIYQCRVPRPLEALDTVGPLPLKPGLNVLLLKVVNETASWEAVARLVDEAGRPVEDIGVKLAP